MKNTSLTGLEWQILELLQSDGRITISDLAIQLNRSRSSISEHIKKMQDAGVLTGFSVQVAEEKLGVGISAFVRLQTGSLNHRKIISSLEQIPEVAECHVLTGSDLVMMRVVARDMPHLREIVDGFTEWGSTTTDVIFSTLKQHVSIGPALRKAISR